MNRKCLIIVVVVAVAIAAAVAVALVFTVFKDDDDDKANDNSTETGKALPVRGQWAYWDSWSECSVTCGGGGTQLRNRACADPAPQNGGANCVGISEESRACADWTCPDCDRTCPDSGELIDCSLCQCNGTSTSGKMFNSGTNLPLADVEVYVIGHEWEPLTMTNRMGVFTLEDLCLTDLELKFVKPGYQADEEKYSVQAGVDLLVGMKEQKKPSFTVHPQSMSLFVGDMIFLRCNATGVPDPTIYEWFKDGDVLEHSPQDGEFNVLQIDNALTTHQGEYKCRATSAAGKKFSRPAKVIVQASGDDTCTRQPKESRLALPPSCIVPSTGETTMDVGSCGSDSCVTREADPAVGQRCCGPVTTEDVQLECEGFEYSVSRVKTCGCTECQESDEITIEGVLVTIENGEEKQVFEYLDIKIQGVTVHASNGEFSWTGTPPSDSITVTYEPGRYNARWLSTASVLYVTPGVPSYMLPITLTRSPDPVVVNATTGALLQATGSPGQTPAAAMTIPPNAIVDENGNPITDDVNVYVTFNDPRDEASLAAAPGEFSFEDDEGETRQLQTFGVFGLQARTTQNKFAYISGKVDFDIDPDSLKIPEKSDGQPDALLWTLDPVTGKWKESGTIENKEGSGRKKRQAQPFTSSSSSEFPPNIPYVNIDKPLLRGRQCYVSVFVYSNENMTEGFPGQRVKIFIKDATDTTYLGQSSGSTDLNGKVCLPTACGLPHEIVVYGGYGPVASTSHHLPTGFSFTNTHNRSRVAFTAPGVDTISTGEGPVHTLALGTCYKSTQDDYHFQYYLKNVPKPGRLDAVELRPNKTLSWYNMEPKNRTACAIAVLVMTDSPSTIQLVGQSYKENEAGPLYGTYTTGIQLHNNFEQPWGGLEGSYVGCMEVKCPGKIYDEDTDTTTEDVHTFAKVNLASQNNSQCLLDYTNVDEYWYKGDVDSDNIVNAVNFVDVTNTSLDLDIQDLYYDRLQRTQDQAWRRRLRSNGFYQATASHQNANHLALRDCYLQYSGYVAAFDCADGKYSRYQGSGVSKRRRRQAAAHLP